MILCRDCAHWDRENRRKDWGMLDGAHVCKRVKEYFNAVEWKDDEGDDWIQGRVKLAPKHEGDTAFVNDGSSYRAELITLGGFGCTLGERLLSVVPEKAEEK